MAVMLASCSTSTSTSKLISIDDYTIARQGDGDQLATMSNPAVYKRGEVFSSCSIQCRPFQKG
jgi:hypothetical protein